jgi:DNA-directed RNA polymerase specialized sigma24 family protein
METLALNTWNELRKELKGFISLRVREPEDVKDILQEVYIKFQIGIVRIRDPRKIMSWLYQITIPFTITIGSKRAEKS